MNKYDIVLDIIEHPDKYSDEEISKILSDKETAEIYRTLAFTASSMKADSDYPDIDKEWLRFKKQTNLNKKLHIWRPGMRAASLGLLTVSSLAAVAIGISVGMGLIGGNAPKPSKESVSQQKADGVTLQQDNAISIMPDTVTENTEPVLYEDAALHTILDEISRIYNIPVKYGNENVSSLRLYFRLDPTTSLQETVNRLNVFDSFEITLERDTIIVK